MALRGCRMTLLCKFALGCILILLITGLFMTYFDGVKFPTVDSYIKRGHHSCQCPVDAVRQGPNPNCSSEQQINPTDIQKIQEDAEPDTVVLVWFWPFDVPFLLGCEKYNITKCHVTANKSLYHKAHALLIHNWEISKVNMPKEPRPWFQKWVWWNMEAPTRSQKIPQVDEIFNLTCNYRPESNIPVPYGHLELRAPDEEAFQLPPKDKLVCWIVSDWSEDYERTKYFHVLKKLVNITIYGRVFGDNLSPEDYVRVVTSCKFYLAFENSVHKDYITEKSFRPLMFGTIPVTLGPPRQNYEEHIPPESFIHVDDFPTAVDLVERLLYLDQNDSEYLKYFEWKKKYKIKESEFGTTHACQTCTYIQQHRGYEAVRNLKEWFWG